jgi:hypothetical protein
MTRIPGRWQKYAPGVAVGVGLLMTLAAVACFTGDPSASLAAKDTTKVTLRGCKVEGGSPPPTAPGGYYTNGTTVCSADGTAHLFHGVDRPSMEWEPTGQEISLADFQAMVGWRANVVRIALNQDFWLSNAYLHNHIAGAATYPATVAQAVQWAEAAGLDVILDLHWSDQGNLNVKEVGGDTPQDMAGGSAQQQMADVNSITFWSEVAAKFKGDGRVLFELYNEPNGISWDVWLNGGAGPGYQVAGMQQLYDAVRKAGAHNVVIAGGLQWAFELSNVGTAPVQGYNIMYATHPYESNDSPGQWPASFGYLAAGDIAPVIATEFGGSDCTGSWDSQLIAFANQYNISWTAWAWYPGGCSFPSLIADWTYTPTEAGVAVQTALRAYPKSTPPDTGAPYATRDGAADAKRDGDKEDAAADEESLDEAGDALPADDALDDAATDGAVKTD